MTTDELTEFRDELLRAARDDCDAASEAAGRGKDARNFCGAAAARKDLAWTVDTILLRARETADRDGVTTPQLGSA